MCVSNNLAVVEVLLSLCINGINFNSMNNGVYHFTFLIKCDILTLTVPVTDSLNDVTMTVGQ